MTQQDPRWNAYLYERHSHKELRDWARSLSYFRFCRAYGGHAYDGDSLRAALAVPSVQDLFDVAAQLGIALERLPHDNPEPVAGMSYSGVEFAKFKLAIPDFDPPIRQPGEVRIAGALVAARVRDGRLDLSMFDDDEPYEVTARTVRDAHAVEALLRPLAHLCIDPPQEGLNCLSPKAYPELWSDAL